MKEVVIRNRYLFIIDILLCWLSYVAVLLLGYDVSNITEKIIAGLPIIACSSLVYIFLLYIGNIYRTHWVHAGAKDYTVLISACTAATILNTIISLVLPITVFAPKINLAANVLIFALICAVRFFIRLSNNMNNAFNKEKNTKVLIIGAGHLAVTLLREIAANKLLKYDVVGLIDDDKNKLKTRIYGTQVLGNRDSILSICLTKEVEEIIFAIHDLPPDEKRTILDICSKTGCKVKIIPGVAAMLTDRVDLAKMRDVEIEDLLEREPIVLDNKAISADISGKTILVTGGGGSIGSELCRQIMKYEPKNLVILDIYENTTYELQTELEDEYINPNISVVIASIRDKKRLDEIFETYKPEIVFHAAAHKHVPLMEFSPKEAIKNNVFGTYNVASCAISHGVSRFVMISTDKAVNPTNVMGATKRMCEMIVQTFSRQSKTEFVAVRFGNVLGSHGSVVPRFKKQIEAGGPVTVTHPEITRFFMTIPEAAQLVLQAASYAKGGEIFVLDMGEAVKIYDLAKKLIRLSGFVPDDDIKIEFTGLREGEKLYEELLMNEEGLKNTSHEKIFVGKPIDIDMNILQEKLSKLEVCLEKNDEEIKKTLEEVIPTYHPVEI